MNKCTISSDITSLAPGRYVRMAIGVWLGRWWWLVGMPLVVLGVMGMADPVWYIGALAYVMLLCPTVMMIVYFNAALRPLAAFATMPHRISLSPNGSITIDYYEKAEEDEEEGAENTQPKPVRQLHFERGDVAMVEDHGNSLVVVLHSSPYDFIVVPSDTLSPENLRKFTDILPSPAKIG